MNATPAAPDLRALAPGFAGRFAVIIASIMALIARAFLRDPTLAPLIVPLCRRLTRTTRGIATIMARLATGRRAAQRSSVDSGRGALASRERSRVPKPPIPNTQAWLVVTLRHEAAGYASQLSHLLAEPGVSELLAVAPTARRLLDPLCRMLGLPVSAPSRTAPANATPPDTPPPAVASQPTGASPPARPAPSLPPAPCSHLRYRWPWFSGHAAKRSGVESDRGALAPRERPSPSAKPA